MPFGHEPTFFENSLRTSDGAHLLCELSVSTQPDGDHGTVLIRVGQFLEFLRPWRPSSIPRAVVYPSGYRA
jgi:hypothetical protein